jgi:hypothetical protein
MKNIERYIFDDPKRIRRIIFFFPVAVILIVLLQDYIHSYINNYSYYLAESILFSSFWLIFFPLFYLQYRWQVRRNEPGFISGIFFSILLMIIHLVGFPILLFFLSKLFYYHAFLISSNINYTLSEHIYKVIIVYSITFLFFRTIFKKISTTIDASSKNTNNYPGQTVSSFIVTDKNKKLSVNVSDILFFKSNTPYVFIHLDKKKYLYYQSLRGLLTLLDNEIFVRIHKSTIVNLAKVTSYKSRSNGDYDIELTDGSLLRLSRNYASDFKLKFGHYNSPQNKNSTG